MADAAAGFKALADENRMLLLRLLLLRSCCVRGLARQLGISPAGVSQHLKVLREAGLVLGEKSGYHTHYTVDREALLALAREAHRPGGGPGEPALQPPLRRLPGGGVRQVPQRRRRPRPLSPTHAMERKQGYEDRGHL